MMNNKILWLVGGFTALAVVGLIGLTLVLVPENEAAYNAAVRFMNAAGLDDDETAYGLLSPEMQAYVDATCAGGRVSACIAEYIPPEWGNLQREGAAVFRRARRDGDAFDVQLVATYEFGQGFAGVCIYHRMEEVAPDDWRVAAWSGFVSCDDPNSGLDGLRSTAAPNRVAP